MPSSSRHRTSPTFTKGRPGPTRILFLAMIAVLAIGSVSTRTGVAFASEDQPIDPKGLAAANSMALPDTYLVTITLDEGGEKLEFSTLTAMRHFSLAPGEKKIRFRGRLRLQADGRELLDFSVDLGEQIAQKDGSTAVASMGNWNGSAYVESGRSIRIVGTPSSAITVTLKKQ